MPTRKIMLTEHQNSVIDRLVKSGRYQNASEVLHEGLRLIEQREADDEARIKAFQNAVQVGLDDVAAGRYTKFESFEDLRRHLVQRTDVVLKARRT